MIWCSYALAHHVLFVAAAAAAAASAVAAAPSEGAKHPSFMSLATYSSSTRGPGMLTLPTEDTSSSSDGVGSAWLGPAHSHSTLSQRLVGSYVTSEASRRFLWQRCRGRHISISIPSSDQSHVGTLDYLLHDRCVMTVTWLSGAHLV